MVTSSQVQAMQYCYIYRALIIVSSSLLAVLQRDSIGVSFLKQKAIGYHLPIYSCRRTTPIPCLEKLVIIHISYSRWKWHSRGAIVNLRTSCLNTTLALRLNYTALFTSLLKRLVKSAVIIEYCVINCQQKPIKPRKTQILQTLYRSSYCIMASMCTSSIAIPLLLTTNPRKVIEEVQNLYFSRLAYRSQLYRRLRIEHIYCLYSIILQLQIRMLSKQMIQITSISLTIVQLIQAQKVARALARLNSITRYLKYLQQV